VRCTTKRRWFLTLYTVPADWLRHSPPEMVAQHLNVDEATISKWPSNRPLINARVIEPGALYCCLPRSPCEPAAFDRAPAAYGFARRPPGSRRSGGASVESCVHVLGRGPVRLRADASLHDHQLQHLQGQGRILAPPLLRLLGSRTPVATIKLPPSSAGPVRCETAERDNARSGPTVLTVRSGVPRMAVQ
jgi:hypothetical protein